MPEFKVHSPFQPTGDQPTAIETIVNSLNTGNRYTTLLGATGTGKSLGHDDPVFIVEKVGDQRTPRVMPIGDLIDAAMKMQAMNVRCEGDTEILDVNDSAAHIYLAQAFNPQTHQVELRPIQSFIRHQAPAQMYRLQTACGRTATFTGDHNLWVLRDGDLRLIRTTEALASDYMPVPETLMTQGQKESLDTLDLLAGSKLYVKARDVIDSYTIAHGTTTLAPAIQASGISAYNKLYAIRHNTKGSGIQVDTFHQVLGITDNLNGLWAPEATYIGGRRRHDSLRAQMPLTTPFLQLLGYYIAEGNHQRGYISIANRDAGIRADMMTALGELGIPVTIRANTDLQVSSAALSKLLSRLCGDRADDKHLPDFWPELSDESLGNLLRAYFDGDGSVERASAITVTTASARLASDLAYALLRFGIWARISKRFKRATNSNHAGTWYHQITLSGQADLQRYKACIGFSLKHKRQKLDELLHHREHSNVDVVPVNGQALRMLREAVDLSEATLAERCDLSRTGIQVFELGKRFPRRVNLMHILDALLKAAENAQVNEEWRKTWQAMRGLCQLRWTPIKSVEPVQYDQPHVYDFCVPGYETFLAGAGGFFVHNTFTMAKVVERTQRPTLVMAHNKTLAAQLYSEFKEFFPENAVEYFVSYYDYYQPEAYVPRFDLYIEKDSSINDEIDRLRLAATSSLMSRKDVIIVASVSCIYGIGNPEDYGRFVVKLKRGEVRRRDVVLRMLVAIQYERNDVTLGRGKFRVRGDTLEVQPAYADSAYRIEFFGDDVERLTEIDVLTGEIIQSLEEIEIYPAKHFITPQEKLQAAVKNIETELEERIKYFKENDKLLEAQRIEQRVRYDLEMLREVGYTSGIENYSRLLDGRPGGTPPFTLLDYFSDDFLLILDESHMTIPQIGGMYNGDRARKQVLVDYGFRLPSAMDNRPLKFEEFEQRFRQVIFSSATPGPFEAQHATVVAEQIIRPTGIVDPMVEVKPVKGQVDDLIAQVRERVARGERVLVTTLTKRMAEDLAEYLQEIGIKVQYLHSEVQTVERVEILRDLRLGQYDVVVGINLLREGLDLPEVSLVAILDADKEGFLRSTTSLIQTIGRAARHVHGKVIMYADNMTDSMKRAIEETERRRKIQTDYNTEHGIEPTTIFKAVRDLTDRVKTTTEGKPGADGESSSGEGAISVRDLPKPEANRLLTELEKQMKQAAKDLEFEKAAMLRDQIFELRQHLNDIDDKTPEWEKVRKMGEDVAEEELAMAPDVPAEPGNYKTVTRRARSQGRRRR
jgi:excinuclease ABC B subunit